MLKQQTVETTMGQLTVSSLNLGEMKQLDALFAQGKASKETSIIPLLPLLPVIVASLRKIHQDTTLEALEAGLTLEDFNLLFDAVLDVSGVRKTTTTGEALAPVTT